MVTIIRHNYLTTHNSHTHPHMYLFNLNMILVKFDGPFAVIVPVIRANNWFNCCQANRSTVLRALHPEQLCV